MQETTKAVAKKTWLSRLRSLFVYCLLVLVLVVGVDWWRSQSMLSGQAPALQATTLNHNNIDLISMSQERPVLVYFWATWCSVCTAVSPSVNWFADDNQVVTIALSSGDDKRLQRYLSAKDYHFPVINDAKGHISQSWGVNVTPTLMVINKGKISSVTTGFTSPVGIWLRLLLADFD